MFISKFIDTEFGKMHYETSVSENDTLPFVIFLHGGSPVTQHTGFWTPLKNIMVSNCNPVLTDRFGYGKSELLDGMKIGVGGHEDTLISLIDHILKVYHLNSVILVGRSVGGGLAARLAVKIPDKIAGLGLIAPGSMKTNYKYLLEWKKPLNLLWDVQDPVVKFENYKYFKDNIQKYQLFVIGDYKDEKTAASISHDKIPKGHMPELNAPDLFSKFLLSLIKECIE